MNIQVTDLTGKVSTVELDGADSVMMAIKQAGLPVRAICGGNGICSTCHVLMDEFRMAAFPAPDADEIDLLAEADNYDPLRSRLSCQLSVSDVPEGLSLLLAVI